MPQAVHALSPAAAAPAGGARHHDHRYPARRKAPVTFTVDDPTYADCTFVVGGMAKGAGMIMPNMATMIAVLATDAPLAAPDALHAALARVAGAQRSTRSRWIPTRPPTTRASSWPTAPPRRSARPFARDGVAFQAFERALEHVCTQNLARADGSRRRGRFPAGDRARHGRGHARGRRRGGARRGELPACQDGRVRPRRELGPRGHGGGQVRARPSAKQDAAIDIMGLPVCRGGLTVPFDEAEALPRFERPEVGNRRGPGRRRRRQATVWTCDFSARLRHDQRRLPLMKYAKRHAPERRIHPVGGRAGRGPCPGSRTSPERPWSSSTAGRPWSTSSCAPTS